MNTFGYSEGFDKKREIPRGRGLNNYGILRAWGGNAFWNFPKARGVKILKPSVVVYGYFLELPNGLYLRLNYTQALMSQDLAKLCLSCKHIAQGTYYT